MSASIDPTTGGLPEASAWTLADAPVHPSIRAFPRVALVPAEAAASGGPTDDATSSPHNTVARSGQGHANPDPVKLELKGTTIPVIAVMIPTRSLARLEAAFEAKLGGARAFFEGEAAMLDVARCYAEGDAAAAIESDGPLHDAATLGKRSVDEDAGVVDAHGDSSLADGEFAGEAAASGMRVIDYGALVALVRRYGLTPVAVRGAPESANEAIRGAGLAIVSGVVPPRARVDAGPVRLEELAKADPLAHLSHPDDSPQRELALDDLFGARAAVTPDAAPVASLPSAAIDAAQIAAPATGQPMQSQRGTEPEPIGAMVVDKAMRSGQRVYAKGRDLVVLAQVNPGAELIADGSIHCYAPLRGRAVAGANGNTKATIFASNFQAELVSIAGVYKTFETIPAEVRGRQMCVRLRVQDGASRIALDSISTE